KALPQNKRVDSRELAQIFPLPRLRGRGARTGAVTYRGLASSMVRTRRTVAAQARHPRVDVARRKAARRRLVCVPPAVPGSLVSKPIKCSLPIPPYPPPLAGGQGGGIGGYLIARSSRAMTVWCYTQRRTMMSRLDERHRRILTTHTGSLPRPDALSALLFARMTGRPYDAGKLAHLTAEAVAASAKTQADLGIDIVSDGEQSKTSFQAYAADRLAGLEPITPAAGERRTRENTAFPAFYRDGAHSGSAKPRWACTGRIKYIGHEALAADLQNLKRALQGPSPVDAFMPSVSPSSCAG